MDVLQVEYNLKNPNNLWTKKYTVEILSFEKQTKWLLCTWLGTLTGLYQSFK